MRLPPIGLKLRLDLGGAIVATLQACFGTHKIALSVFSNNSHATRGFARLPRARKEVLDARVWARIHIWTADVQVR